MTSEQPSMTTQQARVEAERCLQCFEAPCMEACPTHIDIPTFIGMIRSGNIRGAAEIIKMSNALANVCGKICPEEIFCQSVCNRAWQDAPISIRELHYFATHQEARKGYTPMKDVAGRKKTVAVIGGGPAGLGCAFELAKLGYAVTLFDKKGPGGVPANSIPSFRLSPDVLQDDIGFLKGHFTVRREYVGTSKFITLRKRFDAMYIAVGLGEDRPLGLPGENLKGVIPVLTFLESAKARPAKPGIGRRVVVVGGGNVSLDAAATAKRLGAADVVLIYRRSEKEMRVWKSEREEARRLGVEFRFLTAPVEILGRTAVRGIRCRRTKLSAKKDSSGRPIPLDVKGSDFVIEADTVVVAIGQVIESELVDGLKRNRKGFVAVDNTFRTSEPAVFAGGDVISGEGTIVQSVAHGKYSARAIHEYLSTSHKGVKP